MGRRGRGYGGTLDVTVGVGEVLEQLDDEDLEDELRNRGKGFIGEVPLDALKEKLDAISVEILLGRSTDARRLVADLLEDIHRIQQSFARAAQRGELEKA